MLVAHIAPKTFVDVVDALLRRANIVRASIDWVPGVYTPGVDSPVVHVRVAMAHVTVTVQQEMTAWCARIPKTGRDRWELRDLLVRSVPVKRSHTSLVEHQPLPTGAKRLTLEELTRLRDEIKLVAGGLSITSTDATDIVIRFRGMASDIDRRTPGAIVRKIADAGLMVRSGRAPKGGGGGCITIYAFP